MLCAGMLMGGIDATVAVYASVWTALVLTTGPRLAHGADWPRRCSPGRLGGHEAVGRARTLGDPCRATVSRRIKLCNIRAVRVL